MQIELLSSIEEKSFLKIKNIELISYFKNSTIKTPIFLSTIQKSYPEVKALLENGLIKSSKPVKSYFFNLDKLEDFFYEMYQEKIDFLQDKIISNQMKQEKIINDVEKLEPEKDCNDYDDRLKECVLFAKKSLEEIDQLKLKRKDHKNSIHDLQKKMISDPLYKFMLYVRNDNDILFNKRTEDNDGFLKKKLQNYANSCANEDGNNVLSTLKKRGSYKEFSPAMNYYITELGIIADGELKRIRWMEDEIEPYEKTPEELIQEKEFEQLKDIIGF